MNLKQKHLSMLNRIFTNPKVKSVDKVVLIDLSKNSDLFSDHE